MSVRHLSHHEPVPPCGFPTLLADDERIVEEALQDLRLLDREGEGCLRDVVLSFADVGADGYHVRAGSLGRRVAVDRVCESLGGLGLANVSVVNLVLFSPLFQRVL